MSRPFLLYFGCWGGAGHYLWTRDQQHYHKPEYPILPVESLDGSQVFLPQVEVVGNGRLTHIIRGEEAVTVLAWWDRTFDQRGKCNAAVQCDGWDTVDGLWRRFSIVFEPLAKQLARPTIVP